MRFSPFFKLSWCALLITLLAFASARPLNVQADVRQTSVPTTQATENAEPTATPTLTAPCPELPPLTVTAEPTDAVEATPFVGEPGYLGIAGENSSDGCGVTVVDLDPDGPAVQAGVKLNDMIYGAASLETRTVENLKALIKSLPADSVVPLYIIRSKQPIVIRVTLASFADSHAAITPTSLPTATATAEATTEPTTQTTLDATSEPTHPATETVAPPSASEGTPTN